MTRKPTDKGEERRHFGYFSAKYLWPLQPFVEFNRKMGLSEFIDGSIFVEPAPMGGVYVGALTRVCMAVIHDPDGSMSAPVTINMPHKAFDAARGPDPVVMTFENDIYKPRLPEWAQPDNVYICSAGIWIGTKMRHPDWAEEHDEFYPSLFARTASGNTHHVGIDFRLKEGIAANWRKAMSQALASPPITDATTIPFSTEIVGLFGRFAELFQQTDEKFHTWHTFTRSEDGKPGPTIVRFENHPEFVGAYMTQTTATPHAIPDHFLLRTTHEQPGTKQ